MNIESVLKRWITDYSGVATVIQQPFEGGRPDDDFIGFQIIGFNYSDFDETTRTSKDLTFVEHQYNNNATLLLSIHSYGVKAYQALNKLKLSINNWQSRNLLDTVEMSLNRIESASNLAAFEKTKYRHHWQADFEFNIIIRNALDVHKINEWILHGQWRPDVYDNFLVSRDNNFLVSIDNNFLVSSNDKIPVMNSTINYPAG